MDFLDKIKELFGDTSSKIIEQEVLDSYKAHGFDASKPPTDADLAKWAMQMLYKWYKEPDIKMNLPLTALCLAYNMTAMYKLDIPEQVNLKTLLASVFNMGFNMGKYKLKSPFDEKPRPQDLN